MTKWADKKRQQRAESAIKQRQAVKHRGISGKKLLSQTPNEENSLLNRLLDQWEEQEYGIEN